MRIKAGEPEIRDPTILVIASRLEGALSAAFLAAVTARQGRIELAWLVEALESGALPAKLLDAIRGLSTDLQAAVGVVTRAFMAAGESAAATVAEALGATVTFDSASALALQWAQANAARLVTNLTADSEAAIRAAIREAIASGFSEGIPVERIARFLRDVPDLGLNASQALALMRYREELLTAGVSLERAEALAAKYAARLLKQRALMIARTETATAAIAGQQAAWLQAVEAGVIDPNRARRKWNDHPDACEHFCVPMADIPLLDLPRIGQPYTVPDAAGERAGEQIMGPGMDAHPNCRCSESLVFLPL